MKHVWRYDRSFWTATLWMTAISLLLFWVSVIGPLVAGFVGGRKAGSVAMAITWDAFDLWRFGAFGRDALTFSLISYAATIVIAAVIGAMSWSWR